MNIFKKGFAIVAVMFGLAACYPVYDTNFQFIQPSTAEGKQCVSSCATTQKACRDSCIKNETVCVGEEEKRVTPQVSGRPAISKNCSSYSCQEQCTEEYRQCFTSCGGQVVPHVRCVAFCDDRKK
jgi:hypothetical protein